MITDLDTFPVIEMANLREEDTGIKGVICIFSHESRPSNVNFYPLGRAKGQPSYSVSIGESPTVVERSLELRKQTIPAEVLQWVVLNRQELLRFSNEGYEWTPQEILEFTKGLINV